MGCCQPPKSREEALHRAKWHKWAFYINVVAAVALAIVMIVFAVEDKKIGGGLIGPLCAACGQFWQIGVAMDLEKKAKAGVYDKPAAGTESV